MRKIDRGKDIRKKVISSGRKIRLEKINYEKACKRLQLRKPISGKVSGSGKIVLERKSEIFHLINHFKHV